MKCPDCVDGHLFVLNKNHPLIPCRICDGTGILPDDIRYDLAKGATLKFNRLDEHKLNLREYCIRYHISAVIRSEEERGFFRMEKKL